VCADIRRDSLGRGRQTTAGLSTTIFFGYFVGYVFGNLRQQASIVFSLQTKTKKKAVLCQETARCRCKIRCVSQFTAASRGSSFISTAFLYNCDVPNSVLTLMEIVIDICLSSISLL